MVLRLHGVEDVRSLAARLNGRGRTRPLALVSTPAGRPEPWIDVTELEAAYGDLVEIVVITTGTDTFALSSSLPAHTEVYGGAGRVYPVGHAWVEDLRASPLRFAFGPDDGPRATQQLIADGLRMAVRQAPRPTTVPLAPATGVVTGLLLPGRALVRLEDGQTVSLAAELTVPDVGVQRLVARGMAVSGLWDRVAGRLDVRGTLLGPAQSLAAYAAGDLILVEVAEVHLDRATLRLHPDLAVTLDRPQVTSDRLEDLRSLLTPGEVLTARLVAGDAGDDAGDRGWVVSLLDVDDEEEPVPAGPLLPGGPPWLDQTPAEPASSPAEVTPSHPAPVETRVPSHPAPVAVPAPTVRPSPRMLDRRRLTEPPPVADPGPLDPGPLDPGPAPVAPPTPGPRPGPPARRPTSGLPADASPEPTPDPSVEVTRLRAELAERQGQVDGLRHERDLILEQLTRANVEMREARSDAKQLRITLRKRSRTQATGPDPTDLFLDLEEGLRYEVTMAWAVRIHAADKARLRLPDYDIGPGFLSSLAALQGIGRSKVLDVIVEVVTGLAKDQPSREVHQRRVSEAGGSPVRTRADGAVGWRAALQVNTPSARRLHYWVLPGGRIELEQVGVHDDV